MKAHELLSPEGAWTQGVMASDQDGLVCWALAPQARSWCLLGALHRCYNDTDYGYAVDDIESILRLQGYDYPEAWNDAPERTQAEVVALLKELDI